MRSFWYALKKCWTVICCGNDATAVISETNDDFDGNLVGIGLTASLGRDEGGSGKRDSLNDVRILEIPAAHLNKIFEENDNGTNRNYNYTEVQTLSESSESVDMRTPSSTLSSNSTTPHPPLV